MICPRCNHTYPDDLAACPTCGELNPGNNLPPYGPSGQSNMAQNAVTIFVLGILAPLIPVAGFVTGIIAIVMGLTAKAKMKPSDPGYNLAYAGWILGIIGVCVQGLRFIF